MTSPLLRLVGIEKSFYGVPVLRGVSLDILPGTAVGLVGENGAGKSTLMNIVGGNLRPDGGRLEWNGRAFAPQSPLEAEAAGIAFIHQELNLFANLNIAENLFLTRFPGTVGGIDRRAMHRRASGLLKQVELKVSTTLKVEELSAGERQLVEIARALNSDARLMILDEPTTSLTPRETGSLFALLHSLRRQGMAWIYISHALDDVQRLCDRVVVLRDGAVVGSGLAGELTSSRLVALMVGRDLDQQFPPWPSAPVGDVVLAARHLTHPGVIENISFDLHAGEILGLSGLMGSGRTELARVLFGLDPHGEGTLRLGGESIAGLTTRERIRRGMALLTESRRDDGLCLSGSIDDNLGLVAGPRYAGRWLGRMRRSALSQAIADMRRSVRLTSEAAGHRPVRTLSGGNQQKVVLGKWLLNAPRVLILDEPTRGIDVGARFEIYRMIMDLAAEGVAVLIISSELEELLGLCHRILVMSQGEIRDELPRDAFDRERILRAALASHLAGGHAS
jgi:ABC-type sugar transport system ATPase subunit